MLNMRCPTFQMIFGVWPCVSMPRPLMLNVSCNPCILLTNHVLVFPSGLHWNGVGDLVLSPHDRLPLHGFKCLSGAQKLCLFILDQFSMKGVGSLVRNSNMWLDCYKSRANLQAWGLLLFMVSSAEIKAQHSGHSSTNAQSWFSRGPSKDSVKQSWGNRTSNIMK